MKPVIPTLKYQPTRETFADFLRRVQLGFGLKDRELATFLGVRQSVLDRWLSGDTRYLHSTRAAKWRDLGIEVGFTDKGKPGLTPLDRLREQVESLADDNGTPMYPEADLEEAIEWIELLKESRSSGATGPQIRRWGREQGIDVPVKGALPATLKIAYRLAHA